MNLHQLAAELEKMASTLDEKRDRTLRKIVNRSSSALSARFDAGIGPEIAQTTREKRRYNKSAPQLEDSMALFQAVIATNEDVPFSALEYGEDSVTIGVEGRADLEAHEFGTEFEPAREYLPMEDAFWDGVVSEPLREFLREI